jgi:proline dehydrogenase
MDTFMPVKLPLREDVQALEMAPSVGSQEPSLIDQIPLRVVLMLAAPYLAGRTSHDAIELAHRIYRENAFTATLDILGEDSQTVDDCEETVQAYKTLIDEVAANQLPAGGRKQLTVSFKPSMFSIAAPSENGGTDPKLDDAYERIKKVVAYAQEKKINLTLEAEDHRWTDFHLESYFSLINEGYTNLGTVLQSRLFRTRNDIRRFDERMRVRMVIGIYNEPAEIAHTQKPVMKEVLVEEAAELLDRGVYVELASHDVSCIDNFMLTAAIPNRVPATQFETQFLLGVPRKKIQQGLISGSYFLELAETVPAEDRGYLESLAQTGINVRLYLPYGTEKVAGPYCKRRLKANPNMIGFGIKNLLHIK